MNKQLFWKELRVHGWVVAFWPVATAGLFLLVAMIARMNNAERDLEFILPALATFLLWSHGILVGSLLGANDTENGTNKYLETLPVSRGMRFAHWIPTSLVMQLPMLVLCVVLVDYMRIDAHPVRERPPMLLVGSAASLMGLAWGILGGVISKTVLGAFGKGILFQALAAILLWVSGVVLIQWLPFTLGWRHPNSFMGEIQTEWFLRFLVILFFVILTITPTLAAWFLFTRPDRHFKSLNRQGGSFSFAWRMLWFRYQREILVSLSWQFPLAILVGFLLPAGPFCWPLWSLFVGAWWGGLALRQDQRDGVQAWWSAMRPPMGKFLGCIHLVSFLIGMLLLFVTMLPGLVPLVSKNTPHRDIGEVFLREPMGWPGWFLLVPVIPWFFLWYAHGFGVSMWLIMCFRKPIISLIASFGLAGILSLAWLPSLVTGELSLLVVMVVPGLMARCSMIRLREWYALRLPLPDVGVVLIPVLIPLFLLLRMYSIAEPEGLKEVTALRQEVSYFLPTAEAGRFRDAVDTFVRQGSKVYVPEVLRRFRSLVDPGKDLPKAVEKAPPGMPRTVPAAPLFNREEHAQLLRSMHEEFSKIPVLKEPVSVSMKILPPTMETVSFDTTLHSGVVGESLFAQLELKQERFTSALQSLAGIFSLSRSLMHRNSIMVYRTGRAMEREGFNLCGKIAVARGINAADLARLEEILADHQAQRDKLRILTSAQSGCMISLDALDNPMPWFQENFFPNMKSFPVNQAMWWNFVANCWQLPWEKELLRRRILQWFSQGPEADTFFLRMYFFHANIPFGSSVYMDRIHWDLEGVNNAQLGLERTKVALLRHYLEKKRWPADWNGLIPIYLKEPILDPYSGGTPLRWRVSPGEEIEDFESQDKPVKVEAGSLVLWSFSSDQRDDGGIRNDPNPGRQGAMKDEGVDMLRILPVPGK